MAVIARCNSVVLVERGHRLLLIEQGGAGLEVAVFAGTLSSFLLVINGLLQVFIIPWVGIGMFVLGAIAGAIARYAFRIRRDIRATVDGRVQFTFDMETRLVYDALGVPFTSFGEMRLERTWQRHSSARQLMLKCKAASLVLARGSPFADAVDDIETSLLARGIGQSAS